MRRRPISIKLILIIVVAFLFLTTKVAFSSFRLWHKASSGIKDIKIKSISFDKDNPLFGYVGSDRAIYKTEDAGKYWKEVLGIRGHDTGVNFLLIDPFDSKVVYAATENGLYRSNNKGKSWQKVFRGKNAQQRNCLSVSLNKEDIYLGTKSGLFISRDKGRAWFRHSGEVANLEIASIALLDNLVFLATSDGVFRSEDLGENFKKVYSVFGHEENSEDETDDNDDENGISKIRQIIFNGLNNKKIYLASDEGVFISLDDTKSWQRLPAAGLISSSINSIQFINSRLFAATDKGVFEFDGSSWHQIYQGLIAKRINFLCRDAKGNLWAATDKGAYKIDFHIGNLEANDKIITTKRLIDNFKDEPSVRQIQQRAIKYAEVHPEKISGWRRSAMLAAFMPTLSLSYDKNVYGSGSTNTADSTEPKRYGTAYVGPRDWGIDLSWNLSELLWNPDQTSIDSRSKLMVELRDDILDEVTRLYFERRRLQIEGLLTPPSDTQAMVERDLRIDELTASIDAFTGGYLSRMIEEND